MVWDEFPEGFDVTVREHPAQDPHIVVLRGELDLAAAPALEELLVEIAGSTVVVDLTKLDFIDSTGMGALIRAKRRIEAGGNAIRFGGPLTSEVALLFRTMGMDGLVEDIR